MESIINQIKYNENGLVPVVVQDYKTGDILMFAYANSDAVSHTVTSGHAHFWSRSRKALWKKGETSGNTLSIRNILVDCDEDSLIYLVDPSGPSCHSGNNSCFFRGINDTTPSSALSKKDILNTLFDVIKERKKDVNSEFSYTSSLFRSGIKKILDKIDEESKEAIEASEIGDRDKIVYEYTDLLFHMLVALAEHDIDIHDIYSELSRRFGKKKKDYTLDE